VNCRKLGEYICPNCFSYIAFNEGGACVVCQKAAIGGLTHPVCKSKYTPDGVFSSLVYKGVVKKLVYKFKYNPNLTDLKDTLIDLFYEGIIQKEAFHKALDSHSILIPIPLHNSRARKRGYNQSLILAKEMGKRLNIEVLDCLERIKNTKMQFGLKKEEREENIKGAFGLKIKDLRLKNFMQVFLIDDVATSGATLKEAAKVLKKAGVEKVFGLTLAHGE